jgi:hypothetical protein
VRAPQDRRRGSSEHRRQHAGAAVEVLQRVPGLHHQLGRVGFDLHVSAFGALGVDRNCVHSYIAPLVVFLGVGSDGRAPSRSDRAGGSLRV